MQLSDLVEATVVHESLPALVPEPTQRVATRAVASTLASVVVLGLLVSSGVDRISPAGDTTFLALIDTHLLPVLPWIWATTIAALAAQLLTALATRGFRIAGRTGQTAIFAVAISGLPLSVPWIATIAVGFLRLMPEPPV